MLFTEAEIKEISPVSETDKVKDVYIAVFFDGTNNNMVQQAHYKTFNKKVGKDRAKICPNVKDASSEQIDSYDKIKELRDDVQGLDIAIMLAHRIVDPRDLSQTYNPQDAIRKLEDEKAEKLKRLEELQIKAHIDAATMSADIKNPYSNVAILHSFQNKQFVKDESIFLSLYVEGSGAKNLAYNNTGFFDNFIDEKGGLGFGVGVKGVASLTIKGCDYIYRYLSPLKKRLNENTKYHFFVFGFSRGSTCARLFSQLVTRKEGNKLSCESELCKYSKESIRNGRIAFMEHNFLTDKVSGEGAINRNNVNVDFLGIYDTVASIGILKQKDEFINPLKDKLNKYDSTKEWVSRLHYKNANDYGLYINTDHTLNVFHICAADEYRENFALVNIGKGISNGAEIIIPGCHSDVGGSYVDDSGNNERVLYRFIPRSVAHKRLKFTVSKEEIDKIGFLNPINPDFPMKPLNATGLGEMGWIDPIYMPPKKELVMTSADKELSWESNERKTYLTEAKDGESKSENRQKSSIGLSIKDLLNPLNALKNPLSAFYDRMWYLDDKFKYRCTGRYADSVDGDSRCVKFVHNVKGYYSNIPLRMMLARFNKQITNFKLFNEELVGTFFKIPNDLEKFGKSLIDRALNIEKGKREWITAGDGFFSEDYRRLRMKYLHFTASCQIFDFNTETIIKWDLSNFGNECNYDENGKICRIMYTGDEGEIASSKEGVNYMVVNDKATPFAHISVPLSNEEAKLYRKSGK